jgi:hypothetical protein
MSAQVLGISGSPVPNSNTDKAVHEILRHTGLETEFIKLSKLNMEPCRACLSCTDSNRCVITDDGQVLAKKFQEAKAFVLGSFTPYSSLDARSKTFMERMYCLRHERGLNQGKIGVSVITTACPPGIEGLPPAAETAKSQVAFWMMEEGMRDLGSLIILGNVPCIRCGHGDDCPMSGIRMLEGPEATVASVGVRSFENDGMLKNRAKDLGEKIRGAVEQGTTPG